MIKKKKTVFTVIYGALALLFKALLAKLQSDNFIYY